MQRRVIMSAEKGGLKSLRADVCKVKTQGASGARGHVCMNLCIVYFGAPQPLHPGTYVPPCPPPLTLPLIVLCAI